MASETASFSATQTEPKRPQMPNKLLKAAIEGNETDLRQLLGLNDEELGHQYPHTNVSVEDVTPILEPSDCFRSAAGMENTILHILSANGHENLVSTICIKESSLLKACNVRNETPFHHAARFGNINTISELICCAKSAFGGNGLKELLRQKNCIGETALHEAARHGHGAVVSTLMEEDLELAGLVNNDSVSPLYLATARGSLDMVQNMVEKLFGLEITPAFYSGPKKMTALHAAVLQSPELTKELLKLNSKEPICKESDETGITPLHLIASDENHKIAELLLDKDPSLAYIPDSDGSFPVHTAVRMGNVKMIVLLLQRCLDSGELLDANGRNFLHIAIEAKKSDVIFTLLKDSKNKLPISSWKKMLNRMANTMDNKGNTPLHLAAEHGYVTVMHSLLENNELDLTLQNKEGQTAFDLSVTGEFITQSKPQRPVMSNKLLKAAIEGNEKDLKELLGLNDDEEDHPAHRRISVEDVTPTEPSDCLRSIAGMEDTVLHILSANGHELLVATICMKDSSLLKARNVRKETPFHHAARFGHVNTILKLIECAKSAFGEDGLTELLRQKNNLGETVLHEAARHGHGDVVCALMEEDQELAGLVNDDSVSPLYLATARGSLHVVKTMVAKMLNHQITSDFYLGPKKQTALHAAVLQYPEITEELLQLYSEPLGKWPDEIGRNPLHFIASTGNHKIAKLLLDKDPSSVYIPDSDGSFPVHIAVRMGHVKMIALLLERCLDSGQLLDGNGRNFLHIAVEAEKLNIIFNTNTMFNRMVDRIPMSHWKKKMFNRMVNRMDNLEDRIPMSHWKKMFNRMVNTMDNKGNTPLHLAAEHGYFDVMLSLLKKNELDLTLQNKEGLTAFDVSVIQLRKFESTTQRRDILGEYYIRKRGSRFSTGWYQYYTKDQMSKTELIRGTNEEHISITDTKGAKTNSESVIAKAQLVGLGSVLIATVTFAAAFTLPGGTNQDTGTTILGRKYIFKAFVLADFSAFFLSFFSTMILIYSSSDKHSGRMETNVAMSMNIFTIAAKCMVLALALGLYLVLAPIGNTWAVVFVFCFFLIAVNNPFDNLPYIRVFELERQLLNENRHDENRLQHHNWVDVLTDLDPTDTEGFYFLFLFYAPIVIPLIFIFVFALF